MAAVIRPRRVYEAATPDDGVRVLVGHLLQSAGQARITLVCAAPDLPGNGAQVLQVCLQRGLRSA